MFTLSEMCDIAIQIERNGEAVYRRASQKAGDPRISGLLETIADEENAHAHWFKEFDKQHPFTPRDDRIQVMGRDLLQNMMGRQTFSLDEERLSSATGLMEVLNLAIEFEQDTIIFYEMLYRFLDDSATMLQLERIIEEERSHIDRLKKIVAEFG